MSLETPSASLRAHRGRALRLAVLLVIVVAALVHVPFPFWGDQALFTYAAHGLRHGDRLYVDIWDYKQPGIFLWYLVSGSIFGFHEAGIHFAELLWSVAFAAVMQRLLRDRFEHRWVADITPLLTIGSFYALARATDLTQIEDLVTFPLLCAIGSAATAMDAAPGSRERSRWLVLSGLAASGVAYFKLVYALIPVLFWLYLLVRDRRASTTRARSREATLLVGGLVVPLLPLLAYFVSEHLLGTMWWTYVTYPPKVVSTISPPPAARLRDGAWYFVHGCAWLIPAAAVGLRALRARAGRPADPLVVGLIIWLVAGSGTILVQNRWAYQFMLLIPPLGLLAAYGADELSGMWTRARARQVRGLATAVALLLVVEVGLAIEPAKESGHKLRQLAQDDFGLTVGGRRRYQDELEAYYPDARAAVAFLHEPGRVPGAIHVEGNPLIQYLSGRPFALREHGWAPEQSDARLWRWTRDGLRDDRPVYLWVDHFSDDIMRERSPETRALINRMYCKVHPVADGAWYALRSGAECRDAVPSAASGAASDESASTSGPMNSRTAA